MNSIGDDCNELKRQYDACFNSWFTDHFLHGRHDDSACAPIFKVYQACVKRAMDAQKIELREIEAEYTTGGYQQNQTNQKQQQQSGSCKPETSKS